MSWSKKQMRYFAQLNKKIQTASSWVETARICFADAKAASPVSEREIARAEAKLKRKLPAPLRSVYLECDGIIAHYDTHLVMPLDELVAVNARFRTHKIFAGAYMPFDHLLLFGVEGNGDLFAFPIARDGSYGNCNVYEWDHENDSRSWRASSIKDLLARLATDWAE